MFCSLCGFLFSITVRFSISELGRGRARRGTLGKARVPRRELRAAIAPAIFSEAKIEMRQRHRDRDAADRQRREAVRLRFERIERGVGLGKECRSESFRRLLAARLLAEPGNIEAHDAVAERMQPPDLPTSRGVAAEQFALAKGLVE